MEEQEEYEYAHPDWDSGFKKSLMIVVAGIVLVVSAALIAFVGVFIIKIF